ncbi:MAG: hypothetical protein AB7F32_01725 [Victivallaceae bacterium]
MSKPSKKKIDAEINNTLFNDIEKFEIAMAEHWKKVVIIAILVVIAVGVTFGISNHRKSAEIKAMNEIVAAQSEEQLVKAINDYAAYPASRFARIRLARIYAESGRFELAAAQFDALEASGAPAEMIQRAKLDSLYMLENAGKILDAANRFAEIGRNSANSGSIRAEANYSAGRLYAQLKDMEKATACLKSAKSLGAENQISMASEWGRLAEFTLLNVESGYYGK